MGGGSRRAQYSQRFDYDNISFEEDVSRDIIDRKIFGKYIVDISSNAIFVYYEDTLLSIYPRSMLYYATDKFLKIKTGEPGILMKISEDGVKKVFSKERGIFYGMIAGDGYVFLADEEYDSYIKFTSTDHEAILSYKSIVENLYGLNLRIRRGNIL